MAEYKGTVELISGLTPANGQNFALVNAPDIQVDSTGRRLPDVLSSIDTDLHKITTQIYAIMTDPSDNVQLDLSSSPDAPDTLLPGVILFAKTSFEDATINPNVYKPFTKLNYKGTKYNIVWLGNGIEQVKLGETYTFYFDGTNFVMIANGRTEYISESKIAVANGVATLDSSGKIPSVQLPSYVDDVLEYSNRNSFPVTGETGKIYVALDTGFVYRWGGSSYIQISNPETLIDDTAGSGTTNKTWSTNKLVNTLAPQSSPVFTGSISMGRTGDIGTNSVATGSSATASGSGSYAQGDDVTSSGNYSHAEGSQTVASGASSHAEGLETVAAGNYSHAEGNGSSANGNGSHAEGDETVVNGLASHAEGGNTIASRRHQHVAGEYNIEDTEGANQNARGKYIEIIGNGVAEGANRSNARTLDWNGTERLQGDLYVGCNANSTGGEKVITASEVPGSVIDDTAGSGITIRTWSANKIVNTLAPQASPVFTGSISLGRKANTTVGSGSVAVGVDTTASFTASHAEGYNTVAFGNYSHAEGQSTSAASSGSHSEGVSTGSVGIGAHSEGKETHADGNYSHAEGESTNATGDSSHSEGIGTIANGEAQHAGGRYNIASYSGLEIIGRGTGSSARKNARLLDDNGNEYLNGDLYVGCNDDSTGGSKVITASEVPGSVIDDTVGDGTTDKTWSADKLIDELTLKAPKASPEFTGSISLKRKANTTVGDRSSAIGYSTTASSSDSHAEGYNTTASGSSSHAEGASTTASGQSSHAEGNHTVASANFSHAEGFYTTASSGYGAHAEGYYATASSSASHAEGSYTTASNIASHAEGEHTIASKKDQHVSGAYNIEDTDDSDLQGKGKYLEIIGNGTADDARSNARALDWNGNEYLNGDLYVGCNDDSTGGNKVATESYVANAINAAFASIINATGNVF